MHANERAHPLGPEMSIESDGAVRIVRLNRPETMNAVDEGLHRALARVWPLLDDDVDARAVVLTGEGRGFCAGGDMSTLRRVQQDLDERRRMMAEAGRVLTGMVQCRLPVVGAINGPAMGLGCSLAVGCDVTLIAESAYMADPHVAIGLVAGDGGAVLWPVLTSMLKAKEYLYTGDRISAALAVELGLATRVVPDDRCVEEALKVAHRLAALPAQALQDTKRALNMHLQRAMAGVLEFAIAAESECFISESHHAAVDAFLARSAAAAQRA
jgi:enoyl-CoA hydratase